MLTDERCKLTVSDLGDVVQILADSPLDSEDQVKSILKLSDVRRVTILAGAKDTVDLWTRAFTATLEAKPECLPVLFKNIHANLGPQSQVAINGELRKIRDHFVSRYTLDTHPEVGDDADALLVASDKKGMTEAARRLRETAISIRRLVLRPFLTDMFLDLERQLGESFPDPEWARMEIADKAVGVVTATDYLLNLLALPPSAGQLFLSDEGLSTHSQARTNEEANDWLIRRQLDAKAVAVREGTRLLGLLRRYIAVV